MNSLQIVGILGDLSFSNFKTLRIANLLKERKLFFNEISDFLYWRPESLGLKFFKLKKKRF